MAQIASLQASNLLRHFVGWKSTDMGSLARFPAWDNFARPAKLWASLCIQFVLAEMSIAASRMANQPSNCTSWCGSSGLTGMAE